jgi:hypothetical protein
MDIYLGIYIYLGLDIDLGLDKYLEMDINFGLDIYLGKYMSTKNRSQIYVQSQSEFYFFQTAQWWETLFLEGKEMYVEF